MGGCMEEIISKDSLLYSRLLITRAKHVLVKARQKELSPYRVSPEQAYILFILHNRSEKATLAEIARDCERGISTVCTQLSKMENDGLVEKTRETPKSNLLSFKLTDKGAEIQNKSNKMRVEKAIMSVLTEEERKQLISSLNKIINKAKKYS